MTKGDIIKMIDRRIDDHQTSIKRTIAESRPGKPSRHDEFLFRIDELEEIKQEVKGLANANN